MTIASSGTNELMKRSSIALPISLCLGSRPRKRTDTRTSLRFCRSDRTRRASSPRSMSKFVAGRIRISFVRTVVVLSEDGRSSRSSSPTGQARELQFGQQTSPAIERFRRNSVPQTSHRCGTPSGVREEGSFIGRKVHSGNGGGHTAIHNAAFTERHCHRSCAPVGHCAVPVWRAIRQSEHLSEPSTYSPKRDRATIDQVDSRVGDICGRTCTVGIPALARPRND